METWSAVYDWWTTIDPGPGTRPPNRFGGTADRRASSSFASGFRDITELVLQLSESLSASVPPRRWPCRGLLAERWFRGADSLWLRHQHFHDHCTAACLPESASPYSQRKSASLTSAARMLNRLEEADCRESRDTTTTDSSCAAYDVLIRCGLNLSYICGLVTAGLRWHILVMCLDWLEFVSIVPL
jgi:hypothetical protein